MKTIPLEPNPFESAPPNEPQKKSAPDGEPGAVANHTKAVSGFTVEPTSLPLISQAGSMTVALCYRVGATLRGFCPWCGGPLAGHGVGDGPRCSSCRNCRGEYCVVTSSRKRVVPARSLARFFRKGRASI
jgi:hypothetical protein